MLPMTEVLLPCLGRSHGYVKRKKFFKYLWQLLCPLVIDSST